MTFTIRLSVVDLHIGRGVVGAPDVSALSPAEENPVVVQLLSLEGVSFVGGPPGAQAGSYRIICHFGS